MSYRGSTPSTLSDVVRYVRALYAQAGLLRTTNTGTGIEFLIGERFRNSNGCPPRIQIEQLPTSGNVRGPLEIGARQSASIAETCVARVWGAETVDDADRYDSAKQLAMQLLDGFKVAAPGRLTGAQIVREQDSSILTFGEEYQLIVSYTWAVPRDETLRQAAVALALQSDSPQDPDRPNGGSGQDFLIDVQLTNARP